VNGRRNGPGSYTWRSGKVERCYYRNGFEHGDAEIIYNDGSIDQITYDKGKIIAAIEIKPPRK